MKRLAGLRLRHKRELRHVASGIMIVGVGGTPEATIPFSAQVLPEKSAFMKRDLPLETAAPVSSAIGNHKFQHSLLLAIHDESPDGILVVDDKNTVVSYNRRFIDMWHIDLRVIHPDQSDTAFKADRPLLSVVVERVKNPEEFLKR